MSQEKNEKSEYSRISVRLGAFEVMLEGTQGNVEALMGKRLYDFIAGLQKIANAIPFEEESKEETKVEGSLPTEYPPPLGKPANLSDALAKLMVDTGWGRKPRTFGEIMSGLETNTLYYEKAAVATALTRLVRKGTLRRLGSSGSFTYVVS